MASWFGLDIGGLMIGYLLIALGAVIGLSIPINKYVDRQMEKMQKIRKEK